MASAESVQVLTVAHRWLFVCLQQQRPLQLIEACTTLCYPRTDDFGPATTFGDTDEACAAVLGTSQTAGAVSLRYLFVLQASLTADSQAAAISNPVVMTWTCKQSPNEMGAA